VWSYEIVVGSEALEHFLSRVGFLQVTHDFLAFTHCIVDALDTVVPHVASYTYIGYVGDLFFAEWFVFASIRVWAIAEYDSRVTFRLLLCDLEERSRILVRSASC
jgi:hypothetical protein